MRLKLLITALILTSGTAVATAQPSVQRAVAGLPIQETTQNAVNPNKATATNPVPDSGGGEQGVVEPDGGGDAATVAGGATATKAAPTPDPTHYVSPGPGHTCRWTQTGWGEQVYYVDDSKCQGATPVTQQPQTQTQAEPTPAPTPDAPPPGRGGTQ